MIKSLYSDYKVAWSLMGSVWIISDTHFDDRDCLLMDDKWPMPEDYIKNLYKYIHCPYDTLIHLGDVGNPEYLDAIPGYKILITGNHDKGKSKYYYYFNEVYDGPLFIGKKILLSHEPIYGLNFCVNIHGHLHNQNDVNDKYHLNCCSNVVGYKPINLGKEIKNGLLSGISDIHQEYRE